MIMQSLQKYGEPTAFGGSRAAKLRAIGRSGNTDKARMVIYSEHLPKFYYCLLNRLRFSRFPGQKNSQILLCSVVEAGVVSKLSSAEVEFYRLFCKFFAALVGMRLDVAQILARSASPERLRVAVNEAKTHWKSLPEQYARTLWR